MNKHRSLFNLIYQKAESFDLFKFKYPGQKLTDDEHEEHDQEKSILTIRTVHERENEIEFTLYRPLQKSFSLLGYDNQCK